MKYIIEICVAIDIAILGIAYPILIDKISNIGDKYKSEYLSIIFDYEILQKKIFRKLSFFKCILIVTVISFIFKIIDLKPIEYFSNNFYVENSADILVFIFTLVLTISFFLWLDKIMLYLSRASELLIYLIHKYEKESKDSQKKTYLLKTINEFTLYAIDKQDPHLQKHLLEFYNNLFAKCRNQSSEKNGTIYPFDLYYITNEIISISVNNENNKILNLEFNASSGKWLIGESFNYNKISKETYTWLWKNIIISSKHKKLIANYWSSSSQLFDYGLSLIAPEYNGQSIINHMEIEERKNERRKFLEINFALGGLLYYEKQFDILKYILSYSQSQPPSYPLLPQTMDEIFDWFDYFSNDFRNIEEPVEYRYFYPELDNLGVIRNVTYNICLYIALLFVRQFTRQKIYVYQDFKIFHHLTSDLQTLYSYNNRLLYFKNCIEKILEDEDLLKILDNKIDKNSVEKTFDDLSNNIKKEIDLTKLKASLSVNKIEDFKKKSTEIIVDAFNSYNKIKNNQNFISIDESITTVINGELIVTNKSSFTDNDIPNLNFDTIYAESIANNKIKYFIPNSFLLAKKERYLIEKKNLLEAFDKILKNLNEEIIVCVRPSFESNELIKKSKFKDCIITIPSTNNHLNDTFFLLNKKDLPQFEFKELLEEDVKKFDLKKHNVNFKVFTSVIDINLAEYNSLKQDYLTNDDDELKVLVLISFIFLIKWRKDKKIIMLSLTNQFQERGIINDIEDIKPL